MLLYLNSGSSQFIQDYPFSTYLIQDFSHGFRLGYHGPRIVIISSNLRSCVENQDMVMKKLQTELDTGRNNGPFHSQLLPNLRVSPIDLISKKLRAITS